MEHMVLVCEAKEWLGGLALAYTACLACLAWPLIEHLGLSGAAASMSSLETLAAVTKTQGPAALLTGVQANSAVAAADADALVMAAAAVVVVMVVLLLKKKGCKFLQSSIYIQLEKGIPITCAEELFDKLTP
eukprot:1026104-Pelagomonas_calceolata.AAC.1